MNTQNRSTWLETIVGTLTIFLFLWLVSFAARGQQKIQPPRSGMHFHKIHLVKGNTNCRLQLEYNEMQVLLRQAEHQPSSTLKLIDMEATAKPNIVSIREYPEHPENLVLSLNRTHGELSVGIFDLYGRQLFQDFSVTPVNNTHLLAANGFKQGIYFIRVYEHGNLIENDKFLIQ